MNSFFFHRSFGRFRRSLVYLWPKSPKLLKILEDLTTRLCDVFLKSWMSSPCNHAGFSRFPCFLFSVSMHGSFWMKCFYCPTYHWCEESSHEDGWFLRHLTFLGGKKLQHFSINLANTQVQSMGLGSSFVWPTTTKFGLLEGRVNFGRFIYGVWHQPKQCFIFLRNQQTSYICCSFDPPHLITTVFLFANQGALCTFTCAERRTSALSV